MTRPVGRPSTGVKVQVRIPADDLRMIDVAAEQAGITRAETIRAMLRANIDGELAETFSVVHVPIGGGGGSMRFGNVTVTCGAAGATNP
jgi:hypothetical protein